MPGVSVQISEFLNQYAAWWNSYVGYSLMWHARMRVQGVGEYGPRVLTKLESDVKFI